jgi:large subunit ribosomal protein L10
MNRQEKEAVISYFKDNLAHTAGVFLIGYKGMTVAQMQKLRKEIRKNHGLLKVAKVRLVKRALEGLPGSEEFAPLLKEQVALVFAEQEAPAIAKVIGNFAKDNASLKVVAGYIDSTVLSAEIVGRMAVLPSRDLLFAQLCYMLKSPMTRLVWVLKGLQDKMAGVGAEQSGNKE